MEKDERYKEFDSAVFNWINAPGGPKDSNRTNLILLCDMAQLLKMFHRTVLAPPTGE